MNKELSSTFIRGLGPSALAGLAICLLAPQAVGQSGFVRQSIEAVDYQGRARDRSHDHRKKIGYDAYILGPGDALEIELLDLPEFSGYFSIGPDGTLYVPRLRALYVEGLTIEELRIFLTEKLRTYVREPQVYIRPIAFRPVRIYVGGEIKRPGYYTLSGGNILSQPFQSKNGQSLRLDQDITTNLNLPIDRGSYRKENNIQTNSTIIFPTVFDAIRSAQGITPFTDLAKVQVIRKRPEKLGGGRIRTNLNFLSFITAGDQSHNIRLYDGDVVKIGKSSIVLREQLLKAGQSNLSPQFMEVFVTGRVNNPGGITLPQGSSLNQAISLAGGAKLIRGKVEFLRFNREGSIDRRIFSYKPNAKANATNNPILAAGDLIRIQDSILSGGTEILNEVTTPFVGLYSIYSIFRGTN